MLHEEITPCKCYLAVAVVALVLVLVGLISLTAHYTNKDYRSKRDIEHLRHRSDQLLSENIKLKSEATIDDYEVIVTAFTLFGSAKRPGEAHLDNNIQAQLAVLDSARNRAEVCGTHYTDEFMKFGYDKSRNRYSAMYSVWENGGPVIGYADLKRFSNALAQARKIILMSRTTPPDKRITHYHQTGMKSPPAWSNVFRLIKEIGGNSFYQETLESGSYCNAVVPKSIPIPVKVKPHRRKKKAAGTGGDGDEVKPANGPLERIRRMLRKEARIRRMLRKEARERKNRGKS